MSKIAIIGSRGLEKPDYLKNVKQLSVTTPFGDPQPVMYTGTYEGIEIVHLSRRGKGDGIPVSKINFKANLYALKQVNCTHILASTVCRSLQEEICPGEIIILDQFIDMTTKQISGIYEDLQQAEGVYLPLCEPFSCELRDHLVEAAIMQGITVHTKGTVLSIEGPRFSSRAESNLFRRWNADVINMITAPEVILAQELGIPYASLAICTGYDSWRVSDDTALPEKEDQIMVAYHDKVLQMLTYALQKIE
jgi:5'-methylthioadenosine phosphorylase